MHLLSFHRRIVSAGLLLMVIDWIFENCYKSCIQPTAYAIAQGVFVDGASASWWWLRSPGHEQYDAARVGADGSLYYHDVRDSSGAVRPAIWVDLDSPFFQ